MAKAAAGIAVVIDVVVVIIIVASGAADAVELEAPAETSDFCWIC